MLHKIFHTIATDVLLNSKILDKEDASSLGMKNKLRVNHDRAIQGTVVQIKIRITPFT